MIDIFLRYDNFKDEPWYNELRTFLNIGVCCPEPEHREAVKDALAALGYKTIEFTRNGRFYLSGAGGEQE